MQQQLLQQCAWHKINAQLTMYSAKRTHRTKMHALHLKNLYNIWILIVCAVVQLVEYRTRNKEVVGSTHNRSTASNLEQVANLLYAHSASYPQRDWKWVVLRLRGEGLVRLIGAMVCLLAALWVQLSVSVGNGWPHNALRHHWLMPISCHFRDCKVPLVTSLTRVAL